MGYYAVFGDIHPLLMVRVDEAEVKAIQTKLAIGIKPKDIRLQNKTHPVFQATAVFIRTMVKVR